jgi:hypothetical protein
LKKKKAFTLLIREHGYRGNLKVTYNLENERILVRSHHYLSNWTESTWAQTLYYVSMVWIIAEPILWLCRNKFGHSTLRSQWRMIKSEEELYRIHADHVKLQTQYPSY